MLLTLNFINSAKVIVMEEASRLDTAVFYEVVVPLLGVSNTAILGISTPLVSFYLFLILRQQQNNDVYFKGEDNYYSQMTLLKDENKRPLFKSNYSLDFFVVIFAVL